MAARSKLAGHPHARSSGVVGRAVEKHIPAVGRFERNPHQPGIAAVARFASVFVVEGLPNLPERVTHLPVHPPMAAVVAPGDQATGVHGHVTARVVVDAPIRQFGKGSLAGAALHRFGHLPGLAPVVAVDGSVVVVGPKFLGVVAVWRLHAAGHQQPTCVFAVLQRDAGFRTTHACRGASRRAMSGRIRTHFYRFALPGLAMVPAAPEMRVGWTDDEHIAGCVVNDDVTATGFQFHRLAPGFSGVLAAAQQPAGAIEGQD